MPSWTREQLREYERQQANAGSNKARVRDATVATKLRPSHKEPDEGKALDVPVRREEESCPRFEIMFHVYAFQPADYDNYNIKELQDLVVKSGIIPGDDWQTLRGRCIPHKAATEAEVGTRIEIIEL